MTRPISSLVRREYRRRRGHSFLALSAAIILVVIVLAVYAGGAVSATVRVPQDYPTVARAIAAAHAGDTVLIGPGTFSVNVIIDKPLTLRGAGADHTVLSGASAGKPVILVDGTGIAVTISDLTIADAARATSPANWVGADGILGRGDVNIRAENCVFRDNDEAGIRITGSAHVTIIGGTIFGSWDGVEISDDAHADITGCKINNVTYGAIVRDSGTLAITGNEVSDTAVGVDGRSSVVVQGSDNTMVHNGIDLVGNVAGTVRVPLTTAVATKIVYPDPNYRSLQQAIDALLPGGTLIIHAGKYSGGITITKRVTITGEGDVTLTSINLSGSGVSVVGSGDLTLSGVTVTMGIYGVVLGADATAHISNCNISGNWKFGVLVRGHARAQLDDNTIGGVQYGVYATPCASVTGTGNEITGTVGGNAAGSVRAPILPPTEKEIIMPGSKYLTLQQAIDALLPGGTIILRSGGDGYAGPVTIGKPLTIKTLGDNRVNLRGTTSAPVLSLVRGADVTLVNVGITGGTIGILLGGNARVSLDHCVVFRNGYGIGASGSSQATLVNSSVIDNGYGVFAETPACVPGGCPFSGTITGSDNTIPGPGEPNANTIAAVRPSDLSFLTTARGGTYP